ncbi:MAG TPA: ABC transporter substrate-binding protein [Thermomicrobiales bacterium]|nr:ABC transporter substrate-binding protein [Thermomicrobiales bacterium]
MTDHGTLTSLARRRWSRRSLARGAAGAALTGVLGHAAAGTAVASSRQDTTEIEFWHGFAAHEIAALQQMLDTRFAPAHPEIKVNATGGATDEKILAAISGGNPPDVILLPSPYAIGTWAHNGVIQPLDDNIQSSALDLSVFIPAGLEQCKLDDAAYALPFVNFNNALYWNKDLFSAAGLDPETPPKTIEELLDFAEKLTVKEGDRITQIGVLPTLRLQEMAWRFGGDWYDAANGTITANSDANLRALQYELDVANRVGGVDAVQRFQGSLPTGGGAADNPFYQGKIAIMVDGCWHVEFIRQYASGLNYGVAPVPAPPEVENGATINELMTNPIAIPSGAKHVEEAWALLSFLATDVDTSREFSRIIANIPQLVEASTNFTDDPRLKVFVDLSQSKGARHLPVLPITEEYTAAIGTLESSVLTGEAEPKAGLDQLQDDMTAALDKARG